MSLLGTIIAYVINRNDPNVRPEAAKALNWAIFGFLINAAIYVLQILTVTGMSTDLDSMSSTLKIVSLMSVLIFAVIAVIWTFGIKNALKANRGEPTKYPVELNWVK